MTSTARLHTVSNNTLMWYACRNVGVEEEHTNFTQFNWKTYDLHVSCCVRVQSKGSIGDLLQ